MNLNKVFIIGRLTQDPEVRSTPSGQSVATIRVATNRVWNDPSGQKKDATEYHTVIAWGRLGEIAGQYLRKGGLVMFEGRLQTRSWTDQNNNKRYVTEIIAESLQLGPRTGDHSVSDIRPARQTSRPAPVQDDDIPIINENDPTSSGVEEDETKIREEDIPF